MAKTASLYCTRCQVSRDSDFCPACYAYLAWELPAEEPSDGSAAEQTQTMVMSAPVSVHLQVQVGELDIEDPQALGALKLDAGSALVLTASVRNETGIVDELFLGVANLPADWVTVDPPALHLAPVGAREEVAGQATIVITPPRASSTEPGPKPFAITVSSASAAVERARVNATLNVEPFGELELSARPPVAAGRGKARFACQIRNLGNDASGVTLLASDAAQACWFDLPPQISLAAGETSTQTVDVRPVRTLWIGRPVEHRVQMQASALAAGVSAQASPLIYRQRPWVPWWALPAILFLLVLAAALYLALPREVTVPALIGAPSAFAAQQEISQAGLRGPSAITTKVLSHVAPGTVVGQLPAAGASVAPTTPVTLQIAAAASVSTIVPNLAGMTPAQAEAALARVHLKLGAISPALDPKARVANQLPTPGSLRPQEASVQIVLAPRRARVPNLRGRTLRAAERLLAGAGFALGGVTPAPRPGARVLTQLPASGTRSVLGSKVEVVVAQRTVFVPRLRGMTVQAADAALAVCGLSLAPLLPNARAGQLVAAQVPGPGSHEEAGTTVTVILRAKPTRGADAAPPLPTRTQCMGL
ncbi:MAG: PASTA domain-containing protein [Solirubrobacteraceae bacterium]